MVNRPSYLVYRWIAGLLLGESLTTVVILLITPGLYWSAIIGIVLGAFCVALTTS